MHPSVQGSEPGAFAIARQALRATGERPEAAIVLGLTILGIELLLGELAIRALGPRVLADWLLHGEPPRAQVLAALLAALLPLAALLGMATVLALGWIERRPIGPRPAIAGGLTLAVALVGALAGGAAAAAGLSRAILDVTLERSLGAAALFALGVVPGLLVAGACLLASLLALGRLGGEEAGPLAIGEALADLLHDPARSSRRVGAVLLCALPFLVLAFLCSLSALASGSPVAGLGLLVAQSLCSAFAVLWLAGATRRVIGRTSAPGSLGPTPDR